MPNRAARTARDLQFCGHIRLRYLNDNLLIRLTTETMEKFAQCRELSEKPLWLDVCVHDYSFLASERPIRGFPATIMRRRRRVAFSDFGQDLLCLSDPPCCPERP